ncbi:MAG: aldehyde dehydrogenase family protein [Firmicutes bacterium]|jgi:acyl-CoA reductase-like NAD-dependent aldehyde dehydrogenase|nr:aldehyde dehydrogenase family protein [Bacillota bacterium]
MVERYANCINGKWLAPGTGDYVANINPADPAEILGMFPASGGADVEQAIAAAVAASEGWRRVPGPERGKLLLRFADLLEQHTDPLAKILTKEQGKPLKESVGEVKRAAAESRFMAGEASRLAGETLPSERQGVWVQVIREPLGVVGAIMPWNFPVVTPVRKLAPALACGNTVVFKPASDTPWTGVYLMELLLEAGFPPGAVNLVMGPGSLVGQKLAESPLVQGITFTGSTTTGRRIYAATAQHLGRVQLELGGKNPAVVMDAYDLEEAAKEIVSAAFAASGQRCTAISRVLTSRAEATKLTEIIVDLASKLKVGNGLSPEVEVGPLVSQAQLEIVEGYIETAKKEGARVLTGGKRLPELGKGFYYSPTVLDKVTPKSVVAKEEVFGPVLPIIVVDSMEEALTICNDTEYGLAACVFTKDIDKAMQFATEIKTGMVHINHGTASQAHVPFGGVKNSGQGAYSIGGTAKDFCMVNKVVYLKFNQ